MSKGSCDILMIVAFTSCSTSSILSNPSSKLNVIVNPSQRISDSPVPWWSFVSTYQFIETTSRVWQNKCTDSSWGFYLEVWANLFKCMHGSSCPSYLSVIHIFGFPKRVLSILLHSRQSSKLPLYIPNHLAGVLQCPVQCLEVFLF